MNYFYLNSIKNKWEQVYNCDFLTNKKEVKLYDYCEETNSIIWIGIGLY